jgi:hypothetical protein
MAKRLLVHFVDLLNSGLLNKLQHERMVSITYFNGGSHGATIAVRTENNNTYLFSAPTKLHAAEYSYTVFQWELKLSHSLNNKALFCFAADLSESTSEKFLEASPNAECCGITHWQGIKIGPFFQVTRKDGNNKNNTIQNLLLLCPACAHAYQFLDT